MIKTEDILGYCTSSAGLQEDVETAWDLVKDHSKGRYVACLNPHSIVVAESDDYFKESLSQADILLPDGIGVVIAAKIFGKGINSRVAGSDFFTGLSEKAQNNGGLRYFFLGSTDEVLEKIRQRLCRDYPQIEVAGVLSPPFKKVFSDEDNQKMLEQINTFKPDVLWVGMTAPKQEKWIYQNRDKLDVPLTAAIGAVFDFYAGTKKRAPDWVCKMGLEWLPRLIREPRRLFQRNFVSTPVFMMMVLKTKLGFGEERGKR